MLDKLKSQIKNFNYREITLDKKDLETSLSEFFNMTVTITEGIHEDHWSSQLDDVITVTIDNNAYWIYLNKIKHDTLGYNKILITIENIEKAEIDDIAKTNENYLTTSQFIYALKKIKDIYDYHNFKIITTVHENMLIVTIRDEPDGEIKYNEIFDVVLNKENDYDIKEDLILNMRPKDQTKFLSLLLRYAQTPIEFR